MNVTRSSLNPDEGFDGKCPQCGCHNSHVHTEVVNFSTNDPPPGDSPSVVSRTRVYFCTACQHSWSETVAG
jgi:hypothetical protein